MIRSDEASPDPGRDCRLDVMVNGQRLALPKDRASASPPRLLLERDLLKDFGLAQQLAFRSCERKWSLSQEQLVELRGFVQRYEEDLAWDGEAKPGSAHTVPASGGWVAWAPQAEMPIAKPDESALEGGQLFNKVAPSVAPEGRPRRAGSGAGDAGTRRGRSRLRCKRRLRFRQGPPAAACLMRAATWSVSPRWCSSAGSASISP